MSLVHVKRAPGPESLQLRLAGREYTVNGIPGRWLDEIPAKLLRRSIDDAQLVGRFNTLSVEPVSGADHLRPQCSGHDLNETSGLGFTRYGVEYQSDWCQGKLRLGEQLHMRLECHSEAGPYFGGLLENALRVMVAYDVLLRGGILLHSCAIVMNGRASVLFGHSGAGKSTTSRIAMQNGHAVLSDDINVLLDGKLGWQVLQVPFCGSVDSTYTGPGVHPLAGLYRLHKSGETQLAEYSGAHAAGTVCGSAPFINQDPFRGELLLRRAESLVQSIPVKRLYFRQDPEFLGLIGTSD